MKRSLHRAAALLLAAAVAFGAGLRPAAAAEEEALDCAAAVLMEAESGQILYAYNADGRCAPASLTKLMTLLLVFEELESGALAPEDEVTASLHASAMGGSQIWLEPYETMKVDELLRATAIASANDAAVALAEACAGTEGQFVAEMNERAARLGLTGTRYENASGLDEDGHYTTARDVALLSRELLRHDGVTGYTSVWQDSLRDGATELVNTNRLVRFYDGCVGLKTGTTDAAGHCVSAAATRDDMTLIAVVLGAPDSDSRFDGARQLLDYGFSAFTKAPAPDLSAGLLPVRVAHGAEETVQPVADAPAGIVVEKSREADLAAEVELPQVLEAPVEEGAVIGSVTVTLDGSPVVEYPIRAGAAVERMEMPLALRRLLAALCGGRVE